MTAVSKNVYFDVLDDTVNKFNKTYHKTIQMKPIDVKSDSDAEYNVDSNDKGPKFQIGDNVRISKYKTFLLRNFAILKIKDTVPWTYVISDLNGEKIVGTFY